jgi:hypothetical protein
MRVRSGLHELDAGVARTTRNLFGRRLALFDVSTDDQDVHAALGQRPRNGGAQAAPGTGDQGHACCVWHG